MHFPIKHATIKTQYLHVTEIMPTLIIESPKFQFHSTKPSPAICPLLDHYFLLKILSHKFRNDGSKSLQKKVASSLPPKTGDEGK